MNLDNSFSKCSCSVTHFMKFSIKQNSIFLVVNVGKTKQDKRVIENTFSHITFDIENMEGKNMGF